MTKKAGTPSFEQLIDWFEGRLREEEAEAVAAQLLAADEATQADVAWLRKFYRASRSIISSEPPPVLSQRLTQRFSASAQARRPPSRWQRFLATLSFDSHAGMALGMRAVTTPENQRQLVYATEVVTVVLTLQRRTLDRRFDLLGQLLPAQEGDMDLVRVLLIEEDEEFDATITDDLGEFTLTALPAGSYDLVLSSDQYEITLASIDLSL